MKLFPWRIAYSKNVFLYSTFLVLIVFIITRAQYFLFYPVIVLSSDSASYCAVAFDILSLSTPVFDIRTPGYPVFLSLIWIFSKSIYSVALAQSFLTLAVSIFFLWTINQTYRYLNFLFSISVYAFI